MQITIIGLGATGSKIALSLAKHNITSIGYDYDIVDQNNVKNQVYSLEYVGYNKSDSLQKICDKYNYNLFTGIQQKITPESTDISITDLVVLSVDGKENMQEVWKTVKNTGKFFILPAIGKDSIEIITAKSHDMKQMVTIEKHIKKEVKVELADSCGSTSFRLNYISDLVAGFCTNIILNYINNEGEIPHKFNWNCLNMTRIW